MTTETIRTNSREELIQLIGLPKIYALSRYKETIPIHADVVVGTLYDVIDMTELKAPKLREGAEKYYHNRTRRLDFFANPVGKEINDTNVQRPKQLDPPESFAIKGIGFVFSPATDPQDRSNFADRFTLEFWIGQKSYFRKPLAEVFGEGEGNLADPRKPFAGYADLQDFPLVLTYENCFYGCIEGEAFDLHSRVRAWMVLYGLHLRGIC